ncbi:MAG TPA: glucose-1-phosphate cytidylyltransferase [Cyanobacteria bacterium UBA11149]|nr:glucose-1-phosphate cytidylyltransferase [Cyanobacteria bacterium UBA11367]HBE58460.1 glucose-1-phosphate cytidylyltransferase [Cyanobacteria bacterium UBA11366]HBK62751.1 glucose-1-phosphate cytidylyltransferase [Cyanobacteria bacterium UBA11166]HBR73487.1 glucose-1-phosphate cytidylyltransferase [Cyanobacteria bacterium UBA11159]HBS71820.1 glucose-1-phosphate cytidylyltransferase [Cyanobacteria bacterium UBA11153]HBW92026.1 glucose-1-phosphate cytidylyltransferase [Cyanobacteria bacterium
MKAVILAGGYGSRLSEETTIKPKPMVEIGNQPILWHIMKIYSAYGINDFLICCGYKGYVIKEYFANYFLRMSDITFDMRYNQMSIHKGNAEQWRVTLIDTGENTMTGGRLKRAKEYIGNETFCLTYGDGVTNLNINELIQFHREQKALATLTAVQPPGRYGALAFDESKTKIAHFREKPEGDGAWINGGYFVLEPDVIDYIAGDSTVWEQEPLEQLAQKGYLSAYKHTGFWQSMDSLRDKNYLEDIWKSGKIPWKVWE